MNAYQKVHIGQDALSIYSRLGERIATAATVEAARSLLACLNVLCGIPTHALEQLAGSDEAETPQARAGGTA